MSLKDTLKSLTQKSLAQDSTKVIQGTEKIQEELPELARLAAAEGIVLLKNDNNLLPLGVDRKISIFGRVQNDYFYVGYGSGGDVKPPYTISLIEGIRENGNIRVNEELAALYADWCAKNRVHSGYWGYWPRHHKEMPLTDDIVKDAARVSDTAVVVIGRAAGEDRESVLEKGSYYLTDQEEEMLGMVTSAFKSTVVILNSGNIIDLSWINEYGDRLSSVLYAWQGGMESGRAVADILSGKVTPCGRLTDTVALRYQDYPSANDFGGIEYSNYTEDIYVGYRYFETFDKDAVLYPFGYGLGYTEFSIKADSVAVNGGTVKIKATVTNTGDKYAGKETVQVYYSTPQGVLGKPLRSLAAFAKTKLLSPHESQALAMEFPIDSMASYDDAGKTGYRSAYVLEAGDYEIFIGNNVRDAVHGGSYKIDKLTIVKQLQEVNAVAPEHWFSRLVPAEGSDSNYAKKYEDVPVRTCALKDRIERNIPPAIQQTGDRGIKLGDVKAGKSSMDEFIAQLSAAELDALCRGSGAMHSPLGAPGNAGVFGGIIESLRDKGVPPVTTTDGPSGIRLSAYASLLPCGTALACTWDTELIKKLGQALADEMVMKGSDVLLSPGMNIHRNPLGGRNFEYFSEDPLLSGLIAVAVVNGIQSQGVSACPKHFACNNQENNRNRNDSRVSERALREIYLKSFEICVKNSKPQNIMTSYNKINGIWSHYNYDLCTAILRGEWGYEGNVITDWWMRPSADPDFPALKNNAYRVRAQVDVLMPGGASPFSHNNDGTLLESYSRPDGITLGEMQRSAKNTLKFVMRSKAFERFKN